jgi:PAS domain S-box-containing protein
MRAEPLQNMNLAALLIPPSLDPKQALRLRRFGLAALSYAVAAALVALAWMFKLLPASAALEAAAAFVAINLGLYLAMRSGFNLRFDDPSLTRFQILAAITVVMYIIYQMDDGRNIVLFSCFIVFLFGIFRYNAREFTVATLYTLAAYALVINLLMHFRPQAIHDVPHELMSWLALAVFLPYFTIIGGHINTLRRKLRDSGVRENERRESELRFRSLTDMSSDFYWESDAGHRLTMRGSAAKTSSVSMFQQGTQVGQLRWEIPYMSPDAAGWQAHQAVLDAHQPFRNFELSRRGTDGTERHISISGDPVFDASGAFTGYRGVGTDVTARKRAEQALQKELRRHQALMETAIDGIHLIDQNGRLIEANPAFLRMIGYDKDEAIGLHISDWDVHANAEETRARISSLASHSEVFETKWRRKDGSIRDIDLSISTLEIEGVACFYCAARDITERKRADARLHKLTHAVEQSPAATAITDTHGRFEYVNPKFVEVTGYTQEELVGETPALIKSGFTLPDVYEDLWRTILSGAEWRGEIQNRRKNGELYWEYEIISPLKNEHGEIINFIAVKEDITERKEAEKELRASELRFRQMAENIRDVFFLRETDGKRFLYVSPAYEEIWGRSRESLYANAESWIDAIHPDDRAAAYKKSQEGAAAGERYAYGYRIVRPDGSIRWIESKGFPVRDDAGKIVRIAGVVTDVTGKKRDEEELLRFRSAMDAAADGIFFVNRATMRYVDVNATACTMLGYSREELLQIDLSLLTSVTSAQLEHTYDAIIADRGASELTETQLRRKDGSQLAVEVHRHALRSGADWIVVAVVRDITERKRAQDALQQKHARLLETQQELLNAHESLAKADRLESVGRLAAGVAHEVKNPLTIIRLGTDYLAKQFPQQRSQEVVDDVRAAIDRAEYVITDLLDFSRQKAIARRPTYINEVIDDALRLIRHEIDTRNIAIVRNRDNPVPPISADPERLVQVFINLLSNAAQAIGRNGSIEIVERSIRLSEHDLERVAMSTLKIGEPVVTVDIRDSGPGISPESENKLFEPFFTTKPQGEGSGLGLAVARNIVVMHGGSISISNRPEGGASALLMFRVAGEHLTNEKANTGSR